MCNAYGLRAPVHLIVEAARGAGIGLGFEGGAAPNLEAREMIRPTETAPVIAPAGEGDPAAAVLVQRRWGFAPAAPPAGAAAGGAGKTRTRPPVINFRSEGRRFRTGERVLAPLTHFFEYTGARSPKTRWRLTWAGGAEPGEGAEPPFALAALMRPAPTGPDTPRTAAGDPWPESFTLLTTAPGPDVAPIHDRQVVPLAPADWARWLHAPSEEAMALLAPSPAGTLRVAQDR